MAPSGLLSLAEQAYAPRPSPTATTVFVTGLWQRFARLRSSERKTSFSGLWRDTAGGSCVGDPVLPRPLPYFIIQLSISYVEKGCMLSLSTRRFFL